MSGGWRSLAGARPPYRPSTAPLGPISRVCHCRADSPSMDNPSSWFKLEDAARVLKVSTRTVERRLASGAFRVRYDAAGRRLIEIPLSGLPEETQAVAAMEANTRASAEAVKAMGAALAQVTEQAKELREDLRRARSVTMAAMLVAALAVLVGGFGVVVALTRQPSVKAEPDRETTSSVAEEWRVPMIAPRDPAPSVVMTP